VFVRVKKAGNLSYLQIVENKRDGKSVRQRVIASLGHADEMRESGKIDDLARSFLKYTTAVRVVDAHKEGSIKARNTKALGPALVFERLWRELGIPQTIECVRGEDDRHRFSLERAIFLTVLHRLFASGSDRAAEKWKIDFAIAGVENIELHHLYRAMAWLGERLIQIGSDPLTCRCRKDRIEEELFLRKSDLFSSLEVVFFDTTSLYFEGEGGQELGRRGHSKDSRPDLNQMVVGAILDGSGRPICCELWPGNVSDVTTLIPVVERLRSRFGISSVCVVADRGMISHDTIAKLEGGELKLQYIFGVRMRHDRSLRDEDFAIDDSFIEVIGPRRRAKDPSPLKVSERTIDGKRYIVCYNEEQARKDKADRVAIVQSLREKLKASDKNLVGNNGYRKYLKTAREEHFAVDEEKIQSEEKFDGIWILRTNTDLSAADVARQYKELWMVEDVFRSVKTVLETRPIYHKMDETIRGHVFCSFLALMLLKDLESRLEDRGERFEWNVIRQDLCALQNVELEMDGSTYHLRTDLRGSTGAVLKAAGVAVPPSVRG
jgi:transposase